MKTNSKQYRLIITLLLLAFGIWGCASTPPSSTPFANYSEALKNIQSAADKGIVTANEWARNDLIEEFSKDKNADIQSLKIDFDSGCVWTMDKKPLYMKIAETRSVLMKLNTSFSAYTALLVKLSDNQLIDSEALSDSAEAINKNAYDVYKMINPNTKQTAADTGIISNAALALFQRYIETKRKAELKEAIEENQPRIKTYSDMGRLLASTMKESVGIAYLDLVKPMNNGWAKLVAGSPERKKRITENLDLNDSFAEAWRFYSLMEETYAAMPEAHKDLAITVENPAARTESLNNFLFLAQHLNWLNQEVLGKKKS